MFKNRQQIFNIKGYQRHYCSNIATPSYYVLKEQAGEKAQGNLFFFLMDGKHIVIL